MSISPFTLVRARRKEMTYAAPRSVAEALQTGLSARALATQSKSIRPARAHKTVGLWDLGAWVGGLPELVQVLNSAQDLLVFFETQAAIPSGLASQKQRVLRWSEETLGRKLKPKEKQELTGAVIDVDFFAFAKPVRKDLGVQYLIGLSPEAIAGEVDDEDGHVVHSDFFCSWDGKISIVSTVDLRDFAARANRSFEFAIGFLATSIVFTELNGRRTGFHEDNNCLMDYNYNPPTIVDRFKQPAICADCAKRSKPEVLAMANAMLQSLDKLQRPQSPK